MTRAELQRRDAQIHALRRAGWTQRRIAEAIGTTQPQVSLVLARPDPAALPPPPPEFARPEDPIRLQGPRAPMPTNGFNDRGDPAEEVQRAMVAAAKRMKAIMKSPDTPIPMLIAAAQAIASLANSVSGAQRSQKKAKAPAPGVRLVPPKEA